MQSIRKKPKSIKINAKHRLQEKTEESFPTKIQRRYKKIRDISVRAGIPVVKTKTLELLLMTAYIKSPQRILEIGTGYGYSSLVLSDTLEDNGKLDTIEIKEINAEMSIKHIKEVKKDSTVNVIYGDAAEVLPELKNSYDIIFIDGAKGQYPVYLGHAKKLLKSGGVIFADNILYQGIVENAEKSSRRDMTIVKRMREYIDYMKNDEAFHSILLDVEDGIMISYKK